jgi:hypothetical protein
MFTPFVVMDIDGQRERRVRHVVECGKESLAACKKSSRCLIDVGELGDDQHKKEGAKSRSKNKR